LLASLVLGLAACTSEPAPEEPTPEPSPPDTTYYDEEVLPPSVAAAYGTWEYLGYSGTWNEGPADFDRLRLSPYGVFECIDGGEVVLRGRLAVSNPYLDWVKVRFEAEGEVPESELPYVVYESVTFDVFINVGENTMNVHGWIDAPVHHFARITP